MLTLVTRRSFLQITGAGGASLLQACSPLAMLNGAASADSFVAHTGQRYGAHARHLLDVYQPSPTLSNAPVVIFFYGGNWASGERADYRFVGAALASRGFVAVLPDYRLYPEVRYPNFLDDCASAARWVSTHIAQWGGNRERIFLSGHSAGAYNAAMLALNPAYTLNKPPIKGLIGLAGPYDFLPLQADLTKAVFGFPNTPITTQPIHYASAVTPPTLLLTGGEDDVVSPGNSLRLTQRLSELGVPAQNKVYPKLGHRTLIGAMSKPLRHMAPVLDDFADFVDLHSKP